MCTLHIVHFSILLAFNHVTYNCKGLQQKDKRLKIFSYIKDKLKSNGLVFLQETHSSPLDVEKWTREWDGDLIFSHGSSNSKGVLIGFTKDVNANIDKIACDQHGRVLIIDITTNSQKYVLINFYNANIERDQISAIKSLNDLIDIHGVDDDRHVIFSGDFNVIFDVGTDALGGSPSLKTKSLATLINLLEKLDVGDIFRIRNPIKKRFTFRRKTRNNTVIHRRLDYIFLSNSLQEYANKIEVLPSMLSDHSSFSVFKR